MNGLYFLLGAGTVCLVSIFTYAWGRYIERLEHENESYDYDQDK